MGNYYTTPTQEDIDKIAAILSVNGLPSTIDALCSAIIKQSQVKWGVIGSDEDECIEAIKKLQKIYEI